MTDWDENWDEPDTDEDDLGYELADFDDDGTETYAVGPDDGPSIVLSGPNTGSVVSSDPVGDARPIMGRDQALRSGQLMLVHRPHQQFAEIPRLLASVVSATAGAAGLGVIVPLTAATATSHRLWTAQCAAASVRIADPQGYLLDSTIVQVPDVLGERKRRYAPYLVDPMNTAAVLDAQRAANANLLLSPGRALDPGDPQRSLDQAVSDADDCLAWLVRGERIALNLTVPVGWLTSPILFARLMAQLLDAEQFDIWYVRVQWPAALNSTEQPADPRLLRSYKRLAELADDEERTLLLPQTGLTGWLQLAFGAGGFATGLSGSGQAFKPSSTGGSGRRPKERYFEPTLLHSVERATHEALRTQPGYVQCTCPYCPALHRRPVWDHTLANLHQVFSAGVLTGDASPTARGGRNGSIRRIVRRAVAAAAAQPLRACR